MTRNPTPLRGNRPWTTAEDAAIWKGVALGETPAMIAAGRLPNRRVAEIAGRVERLRIAGEIDPPTSYRYELPANLLYVPPPPTDAERRARVHAGWMTNDYRALAGEGDE